MDKEAYLRILSDPDPKARVKTRWWWFGCKVREEDIIFQLDEMHNAGIGGVELQITYPLQAGDDNYEYFSPAFFRILQFTSDELKKRGMTLDLTLGSSWPFGGPFVPFAKSAVSVIPLELTVEGPCLFSYDFTNRISGEIVGCIMGQMEGAQMLPDTLADISSHLTDRLLYNWPWGILLSDVQIPEGVWKIVVFVSSQFREHVLMPTRGAHGYVVDHNNREAMRFFLEHAGTPLAKRLGRGAVDNFFCDSLEVFGHNWTAGLYEEFEKRRGYSLRPYIYALWGEIRGITPDIRYDFHKTLSELTVEGFFEEMTDWCHEAGSRSRIQAHGTWGDVLLCYGAADIPEGETFSAWDKFSVNTVHRRLASSAGHLYNRKVISNESFTWLRFPRFTETPEQIKIAADSIFADGINQIVNHGYPYSPKEGEPLYFYASSTISHTNTWWKYYPPLALYMNRVSEFLQTGEPAADICIYLPQPDIWAENPLGDVHMCMKLEEKIGTRTADMLAHAGYWFDYINDEALVRWQDYAYKLLIIMETDRMPMETVRQVEAFARSGGKVICAGKMPSSDCGFLAHGDAAGAFRKMKEQGLVTVTEDKHSSLLACLEDFLAPDLCVTEGRGDIGYVHRRDGETDIYFIANMSLHAYDTTLKIKWLSEGPCGLLLLDPMKGEEAACKAVELCRQGEDAFLHIDLCFDPGQSYILLLESGKDGRPVLCGPDRDDERTRLLDLSAGWTLTVPEKELTIAIERLEGFERIEELKYYSGEAVYSRSFSLDEEALQPKKRIVLHADRVEAAAAVYVNGIHVRDWIMRPWEADITAALRPGENEVRIEVSNLLINRFLDPEYPLYEYPDEIMDVWPYFPQELIKERGKRLAPWREREMVKEVYPSGLIGAVYLEEVEEKNAQNKL